MYMFNRNNEKRRFSTQNYTVILPAVELLLYYKSQDKPWERKAAMREWDMGKNEKEKEKDKLRRDDRPPEKRRHRTPSPEPGMYKKSNSYKYGKLEDNILH